MTQDNISLIFCSACGQKNEGDANFCAKCGKQITSTVTVQPPSSGTIPPPPPPAPEGSAQKASGIVTAMAVVGFVFGLIGMLGSFIPIIGVFTIKICIAAALMSILSIVVAFSQNASRTFPIVALTISLIGVGMWYVQINKINSATRTARQFTNELLAKSPSPSPPPSAGKEKRSISPLPIPSKKQVANFVSRLPLQAKAKPVSYQINLYRDPQNNTLRFNNNGEPVVISRKFISIVEFSQEKRSGEYVLYYYDISGNSMVNTEFDSNIGPFKVETPYFSLAHKLAIVDKSTNKRILSFDLSKFATCNGNGICEFEKGENYFTCLGDCGTSNPTYSDFTRNLLENNNGIIKDHKTGDVFLRRAGR